MKCGDVEWEEQEHFDLMGNQWICDIYFVEDYKNGKNSSDDVPKKRSSDLGRRYKQSSLFELLYYLFFYLIYLTIMMVVGGGAGREEEESPFCRCREKEFYGSYLAKRNKLRGVLM